MNDNPYEAPKVDVNDGPAERSHSRSTVDFAAIIHRWERLRIVYNGWLLFVTIGVLIVLRPPPGRWLEQLVGLCFGAFLANLCFMTGPAIDGYAQHFGFRRSPTPALMVAGLPLAGILAVAYLIAMM